MSRFEFQPPPQYTPESSDEQGSVAVQELEGADDTQETPIKKETEEITVDPEFRKQMEEYRAKAFAHVASFEQSIAELQHGVAMSFEMRDKSVENRKLYEDQLQYLEAKRAEQAQVERFEDKLWGDTLEDHAEGKKDLLDDIAGIKSSADVLAMFDYWGALPGASTVDRPVIDRDGIVSFFEKIKRGENMLDLEARVEKLFPNKRLRQKIYDFLSHREPVPAEEVWDGEEEPILSPNQDEISAAMVRNREARVKQQEVEKSRFEQEDQRDPLDEMQDLEKKERLLIEAQKVIQSKVFKYAPFLMKLTAGGREKLKAVERAGFTLNTRGASPETLAMAQALKLKAVRERHAQLSGGVTQNFADDLDRRRESEEEIASYDLYGRPEDIQSRREEKQALQKRNTRGTNLQNIQSVLSVKPTTPRKKATVAPDDGFRIGVDHTMGEDGKFRPYTSRRSKPEPVEEPVVQQEEEIEITQNEPIVIGSQESQKERKIRKDKELVAVFERKQTAKKKLISDVEASTGKKVNARGARKAAIQEKRKKII